MIAPSNNGWTRCPPGEFRRLAADLTARRLRRLWITRLAWAAGALLAVAACWQMAAAIDTWHSNGWQFGGTAAQPGKCSTGGLLVPTTPSTPTSAPNCGK
jgi:hypothetical protein